MTNSFIDDYEKMKDFFQLSKEDWLNHYSYMTEAEYVATENKVAQWGLRLEDINENLDTKPIKIHIAWGSSKSVDDIKKYTFDSEKEYLAFLQGVDESNGWMDYDLIGDDQQCNWPNIEMWKRQYCPEEKSNG
jgi:hypothetical protein